MPWPNQPRRASYGQRDHADASARATLAALAVAGEGRAVGEPRQGKVGPHRAIVLRQATPLTPGREPHAAGRGGRVEKGEREVGGELTLSPAKLHVDGGGSQGKKTNGKGERERDVGECWAEKDGVAVWGRATRADADRWGPLARQWRWEGAGPARAPGRAEGEAC